VIYFLPSVAGNLIIAAASIQLAPPVVAVATGHVITAIDGA
jgi:hypothetical protein